MSGWPKVKLLNAHGAVLASHEQRITSDMLGTSPKPKSELRPTTQADYEWRLRKHVLPFFATSRSPP